MAPCEMKFVPINELGNIRNSEVRWNMDEKEPTLLQESSKTRKMYVIYSLLAGKMLSLFLKESFKITVTTRGAEESTS